MYFEQKIPMKILSTEGMSASYVSDLNYTYKQHVKKTPHSRIQMLDKNGKGR